MRRNKEVARPRTESTMIPRGVQEKSVFALIRSIVRESKIERTGRLGKPTSRCRSLNAPSGRVAWADCDGEVVAKGGKSQVEWAADRSELGPLTWFRAGPIASYR